jgi:hypothetical protein
LFSLCDCGKIVNYDCITSKWHSTGS